MKNLIAAGEVVPVIAPTGGLASGDFAVVGNFYGVSVTDAAEGATAQLRRTGIFELPKATGAAWTKGDKLYWDGTNKVFTKTATGNKEVGRAWADAVSGAAIGQVDIYPGFSLAVA